MKMPMLRKEKKEKRKEETQMDSDVGNDLPS